jgi:excisionase family DNA binding protein
VCDPPLLTIRRAIAYSGVSLQTLNRAIARGELPLHGRAGGRRIRLVRRDDLDRWLAGEQGSAS